MEIWKKSKQKRINTMLSGMRCKANVFLTYGFRFPVTAFLTLILADVVVPSGKLITGLAVKYKRFLDNIVLFWIPIHNRDNEVY